MRALFRSLFRTFAAAATGGTLALAATAAYAPANAKMSYEGEQITILIGYGFGGTYAKYAHQFADHLGEHIPGEPNIIVQSMPGAGGIVAANYAYNVMPKDGKHLLVLPDTAVIVQLLRGDQVRYDAREFQSLGSSNQTNTIMVVRRDTGVTSWQDLKKNEVIFGHTGPGSTAFLIPSIAKGLLDLKIDLIGGYKGSSKTIHAVEQGEVEAAAYNWLAWNSKVPQWFEGGENSFAIPILQNGLWRDPDLKDVPMLSEVVDKEDLPIVRFMATLGIIGRGLVLPPGTPEDALATLRPAFKQMIDDPDYVRAVEKGGLRVLYTPGEQIDKAIDEAIDEAREDVVKRADKIIFGDGAKS